MSGSGKVFPPNSAPDNSDERVYHGFENGAATVYIKGTNEVDIRMLQESGSFTFSSGSVDIPFIEWADEISWDVTRTAGAGADTISMYVSRDGINFSGAAVVPWNNAGAAWNADGTFLDGEDLTYAFNGKSIRFTHSGTTDTFQVNWSARNSGRRAST